MDSELKRFVYMNKGWALPTEKKPKPTTGKLIWVCSNKTEVIFENRTFPFLNAEKKKRLNQPQYKGGVLKVTY